MSRHAALLMTAHLSICFQAVSMRCGALRKHHSQYTGHEFTEPQPASSSEEAWHVRNNGYGRPSTLLKGKLEIGELDHGYAKQIIRDHQLAALVPRLVTALESLAVNSSDNTGLCWCVADPRVFGHCNQCEQIRVIVTTAAKHQKQ